MLPGVSNKHLMASWGTPETDSDGGCQATGPLSLSVQPHVTEPVHVRAPVETSGCTSQP